ILSWWIIIDNHFLNFILFHGEKKYHSMSEGLELLNIFDSRIPESSSENESICNIEPELVDYRPYLQRTDENYARTLLDKDTGIPKIIMQTWENRDIPEKWKTSPISI